MGFGGGGNGSFGVGETNDGAMGGTEAVAGSKFRAIIEPLIWTLVA